MDSRLNLKVILLFLIAFYSKIGSEIEGFDIEIIYRLPHIIVM